MFRCSQGSPTEAGVAPALTPTPLPQGRERGFRGAGATRRLRLRSADNNGRRDGTMALSNRLGGHTNSYHTHGVEAALEGIAAAGYRFVELSAVRGWTEHV